MKRCPTCQSIYTDESLSYCLQDGSQLRVVSDSASSANATLQMSGRELPPTEILKPEDMPTARIEAKVPTREQPRARPTALDRDEETVIAATAPRSNAAVIALSVVVALLLVTLGGLLTWVMLRDKAQDASSTTTSNPATTSANTTPQPSAGDMTTAQREVQDALNAWADSIRQRNLDEHMKLYADKLDVFYNSSNVSADKVRLARDDAFSRYDTMDIRLSKTKIEITDSGTRAVATFDKIFDFKGVKNFSGAVESRLYLAKAGGRWRITGEKDLQTYYVNK